VFVSSANPAHSKMARLLHTALLEWISENAVRAYTTLDSAVSYLSHA